MYEFLAPWGVLAPALTAALTYLFAANLRRRNLLVSLEAPAEARDLA